MLITKQYVGYQYDTDGRLTAISDPVINRSYTYDTGNRITQIGIDGQLPDTNHFDFSFTHDPLDRLTNESMANGAIQRSFSYDSNSNLVQKTAQFGSTSQTTATQITAGTNHLQNYQYDGSGKVTSDGQRSYTYNSEGRIERIQNGSVGVYNAYNALGQRVQKNSGDSKTYFLYDESGALTGEYDTNGNVIREYAYLAGRPVLMMADDSVLHIHTDHLGTPRAVSGWMPNATTGWSGVVLWRMDGDAFGDVQPQLATIKMPLRMAGQYADDETGLFYNYFRFYDPKTGRYVENDPIDLAGGLNRYAYVGGSPLHMVDPTGQFSQGAAAGAALGGAIGAGFGAVAGGGLGGFVCSLFAPGIGTVGCGAAGGSWGATEGGAVGSLIGAGLGAWMEASDNAKAEPDVKEKPAICDVEPDDLCEQLALAEAKAGAGVQIMGQMGDEPRLIAHYGAGPWVKKELKHTCPDGRQKVIHYFHSLTTGKNVELKFKKR